MPIFVGWDGLAGFETPLGQAHAITDAHEQRALVPQSKNRRRRRSATVMPKKGQPQRALAAAEWGAVGPLRVRMALHSGMTEERADDYVGPLLNRAARLLAQLQ